MWYKSILHADDETESVKLDQPRQEEPQSQSPCLNWKQLGIKSRGKPFRIISQAVRKLLNSVPNLSKKRLRASLGPSFTFGSNLAGPGGFSRVRKLELGSHPEPYTLKLKP